MKRIFLILAATSALVGAVPMLSLGQKAEDASKAEDGAEKPAPKQNAEGEESEPPRYRLIPAQEVEIKWLIQSAYSQSLEVRAGLRFKLGEAAAEVIVPKPKNPEDKPLPLVLQVGGEEGQTLAIPETGGQLKAEVGGKNYRIKVFADDLGRRFFVPATALRVSPELNPLLLIDANFNGRYDDELVDWVVWGDKGRYAFPYAKRLPLDDGVYTFDILTEEKGIKLRYRRSLFLNKGSANELQVALNRLRMDFGLFPSESDAEWDEHCLAHANYMKKNDAFTHHELKENEGYTPRGHLAGMSSILSKGTMSATHALYSLWDTPLHGFDIRSPYFSNAAFGYTKPYSVIRTTGLVHRPFAFGQSWSFPPNNASNIPIEWPGKESPEPRIDTEKGFGYPITFSTTWGVVNFTQEEALMGANTRTLERVSRPRISDAKATLEAFVDNAWQNVPIQHTFDTKSAPPAIKGWGWIYHYILPLEKMRPFTLHRITLTWKDAHAQPRSYLSCFTTGKDRGGHQWESAQLYAPKAEKTKD